ncbi:MAG: molybdopterin synthase [Acidobacteria bacterium]|nr:MAG: molybdopterin synthase [Acidobacteriota bacterium]PYV74684.1 MAG: molybdopterin synthase [Acidobacteriota bacterium]
MQVRVLFFGVLKDIVSRSAETLDLPEGAVAADVVKHYERFVSAKNGILSSVAISINQEYSNPNTTLHAGDEIALLPPVSGGSHRALITRERIDPNALVAEIKHPEDGASVVFEGVVRNHSRGRRTLFLEYEAYEPMALKELESLIAEAIGRFQIRDAAVVHRLGRLEIGETSVLVVVTSAHRDAAFDACRWIIDTLKKMVPIWKKEYFEDGAVWADGEPFPAEIASPGAVTNPQTPASK